MAIRVSQCAAGLIVSMTVGIGGESRQTTVTQPHLGVRTVAVLTVDGLRFKDLNKNGRLDPYEDWRQSIDARVADLVGQMTLEEKAGLMVGPTLPKRRRTMRLVAEIMPLASTTAFGTTSVSTSRSSRLSSSSCARSAMGMQSPVGLSLGTRTSSARNSTCRMNSRSRKSCTKARVDSDILVIPVE